MTRRFEGRLPSFEGGGVQSMSNCVVVAKAESASRLPRWPIAEYHGLMNFQNGKRTFRPSDSVTWTETPGELVIFDQRTDKYHSLNVSASAIWRELATGRTEDAIVEALVRKFGTSREKILPDVTGFLAAALSSGLIVARADEPQ